MIKKLIKEIGAIEERIIQRLTYNGELPYDCEVEWLAAVGTSNIPSQGGFIVPTYVQPNQYTSFRIDGRALSQAEINSFGVENALSAGEARFGVDEIVSGSRKQFGGTFAMNGWGRVQCFGSSLDTVYRSNERIIQEYNASERKMTRTIVSSGNVSSKTVPESSLSQFSKMFTLFGRWTQSSSSQSLNDTVFCAPSVLYGAKFWSDNWFIHDFVPVSKNGVGYLYDKVTREMFGNLGTGKFIVGPAKYDSAVEYLQTDGNQWIDTGCVVTPTTCIQAKFTLLEPIEQARLFGINEIGKGPFDLYINGTYKQWAARMFVQSAAGMYGTQSNTEYTVNVNPPEGTVTINTQTRSYTDMTSYTSTYTLPILARRNNGKIVYKDAPMKVMLKSFKIYQDNILVRNLIPVRVGRAGWLYDSVSKHLFGNSGTGEFGVGPDTTLSERSLEKDAEYKIEETAARRFKLRRRTSSMFRN